MPSPTCTVNGSAPPQDVAANATVTVALANPAGAGHWFLGVTSCDDSSVLATIQASLSINQVAKTATFTAPGGLGSAVILTSTVCDQASVNKSSLGFGYDTNGQLQKSYTTTFKVNVPTTAGLHVTALSEVTEQDPTFGWTKQQNQVARAASAAVAPVFVTSLSALVPTQTRQFVSVDGYSASGDGGGGLFVWHATDTRADDGGTIIKVASIATGRWNRVYVGTLNPRWFGAKGDKSNDDTPAVNAAITAAGNGGAVEVSFPGTYRITGPIPLAQPCTLRMQKGATFWPNAPDGASNATTKFVYITSSDVILEGVSFDYAGSATHTENTRYLIFAAGSSGSHISRVHIKDCRFTNFLVGAYTPPSNTSLSLNVGHGVFCNYVDELLVEKCFYNQISGFPVLTESCKFPTIRDNEIRDPLWAGITINSGGLGGLIKNNRLISTQGASYHAYDEGGMINAPGTPSDGFAGNLKLIIEGNYCTGYIEYGEAIRIASTSDVDIIHNRVENVWGTSTSAPTACISVSTRGYQGDSSHLIRIQSNVCIPPKLANTFAGGYPALVIAGTVDTTASHAAAPVFSSPQTFVSGQPLIFASQPGVVYFVASNVTSVTTVPLTSPFTGTGSSTDTARGPAGAGSIAIYVQNPLSGSGSPRSTRLIISGNHLDSPNGTPPAPISGTVTLTASTTVTFGTAQSFKAGDAIVFQGQPLTTYYIAADTTNSTTATLTASYSGTTGTFPSGAYPIAAYTTRGSYRPIYGAVTTNGTTTISLAQAQTFSKGDGIILAAESSAIYWVAADTAMSSSVTVTVATVSSGATTGHTFTPTFFTQAILVHGNDGGWDDVHIHGNEGTGWCMGTAIIAGFCSVIANGGANGTITNARIHHNTFTRLSFLPNDGNQLGVVLGQYTSRSTADHNTVDSFNTPYYVSNIGTSDIVVEDDRYGAARRIYGDQPFEVWNGTSAPTRTASFGTDGKLLLDSLSGSQAVVTDGSKKLTSMAYATAATVSTIALRDSSGNGSFVGVICTGALYLNNTQPIYMKDNGGTYRIILRASGNFTDIAGSGSGIRFNSLDLGGVIGTLDESGNLKIAGGLAINGSATTAKPTITGSRGGNAALASLLTALATAGFITDSTTA